MHSSGCRIGLKKSEAWAARERAGTSAGVTAASGRECEI
ncbi:hypothetical protein BURPS305_3691 [Burkholderia pseudomallei 305]|nr:hypothetical protein BURPS305_3691 [Burkholderia pseudomallei 305]EEP51649.1 hypothetical protein GBP346_B2818 [Burkholderia pseudomallei MSHR346]